MGGTPFGRQDFSVLSPSPRSFARVFVSRSCLAFSRSSRVLALSRSSLASVFWFESIMCVYDVRYMLMLISAFLNDCQKKSY